MLGGRRVIGYAVGRLEAHGDGPLGSLGYRPSMSGTTIVGGRDKAGGSGKKGGRKRGGVFRLALMIAVVVMVLVIAVVVLLPTVAGPIVRGVLAGVVQEQTRGEVTVEAVRLGWFGEQSIRGVKVMDGGEVLTDVSVRVPAGLLGLAQLQPGEVEVKWTALTLEERSDGTIGLAPAGPTPAGSASGGEAGPGPSGPAEPIRLPAGLRAALKLDGGDVTLRRADGSVVGLTGVQGHAELTGDRRVTVTLDAATKYTGAVGAGAGGSGAGVIAPGVVRVRGEVTDLFDGTGLLRVESAKAEVTAEISKLASALVDALSGGTLPAKLSETLGEEINAGVRVSGTMESALVSASLDTEAARVGLEASASGGMLGTTKPLTVRADLERLRPLVPGLAEALAGLTDVEVGSLPVAELGVSVSKVPLKALAEAVDPMAVDLREVGASVRVSVGEVMSRVTVRPPAAVAGSAAPVGAGAAAEPVVLAAGMKGLELGIEVSRLGDGVNVALNAPLVADGREVPVVGRLTVRDLLDGQGRLVVRDAEAAAGVIAEGELSLRGLPMEVAQRVAVLMNAPVDLSSDIGATVDVVMGVKGTEASKPVVAELRVESASVRGVFPVEAERGTWVVKGGRGSGQPAGELVVSRVGSMLQRALGPTLEQAGYRVGVAESLRLTVPALEVDPSAKRPLRTVEAVVRVGGLVAQPVADPRVDVRFDSVELTAVYQPESAQTDAGRATLVMEGRAGGERVGMRLTALAEEVMTRPHAAKWELIDATLPVALARLAPLPEAIGAMEPLQLLAQAIGPALVITGQGTGPLPTGVATGLVELSGVNLGRITLESSSIAHGVAGGGAGGVPPLVGPTTATLRVEGTRLGWLDAFGPGMSELVGRTLSGKVTVQGSMEAGATQRATAELSTEQVRLSPVTVSVKQEGEKLSGELGSELLLVMTAPQGAINTLLTPKAEPGKKAPSAGLVVGDAVTLNVGVKPTSFAMGPAGMELGALTADITTTPVPVRIKGYEAPLRYAAVMGLRSVEGAYTGSVVLSDPSNAGASRFDMNFSTTRDLNIAGPGFSATVIGRMSAFPLGAVDALAGLPGLARGVLGPNMTADFRMDGYSATGGVLKLNGGSENATFAVAGTLGAEEWAKGKTRRVFVASEPVTFSLAQLSTTEGFDLPRFLPYVGRFVKDPARHRATGLSVANLRLPIGGADETDQFRDLRDMKADVTMDLGQAQVTFGKGLDLLLRAAQQARGGGAAGDVASMLEIGTSMQPFAVSLNQGVMKVDKLKVPLGEFEVELSHTMDLIGGREDIVLVVPAGMLTAEALKVGGVGGELLTQLLRVPIRRAGVIGGENAWRVDLAAAERDPAKLRDAIRDGAGDLLRRGLEGLKKDGE